MTELVRYDAMCAAIDAAYQVDEVKDIRDKALAIEVYTQQAQNIEAERKAVEIRLRAERKAGELLRDREKAKAPPGPGRGNKTRSSDPTAFSEDRPKTLRELGISKDQSSQWQKLAAVPKDDFEAELARPDIPTTAGIIAAASTKTKPPTPPIDWTTDQLARKAEAERGMAVVANMKIDRPAAPAEITALRSSDLVPVSNPLPRAPARSDAERRAASRKEAKLVRWIVREMVSLHYDGDGCQMTYPRHVMAGAPYEGADLASLADGLQCVAALIEQAAECVTPGALRKQAASLRKRGHTHWADDLDDVADKIGA